MATATRHQDISSQLLEHAEQEFEKGDLIQASEKAWGAVAHCVKSVAKRKRWPNASHKDINKNARRLIALTPTPVEGRRMLLAINALHTNFYEENLDPEDVKQSITDAHTLVDALNKAASQ